MAFRFKKYTSHNASYILLSRLPSQLVVDKKTWKIEIDCINKVLQEERMEGLD
ncbi:MAG TPA: hypothetical protein VFT78_12315 [Hanamia sp.]|nr:hypothetical protein [Hanamia sp.]